MNLSDLLKDSACKLTRFKPTQIAAIEAGISLKDGSNHPRFDEGVLRRLPVPTALIARGNELQVAVQKMITLRERATQLLEVAKRAVEVAIEQDEAAGLAYSADQGVLA